MVGSTRIWLAASWVPRCHRMAFAATAGVYLGLRVPLSPVSNWPEVAGRFGYMVNLRAHSAPGERGAAAPPAGHPRYTVSGYRVILRPEDRLRSRREAVSIKFLRLP